VHAEANRQEHGVTLLLDATEKQIGQLCREWYGIVDVIEVRSSASLHEHENNGTWTPHPPISTGVGEQSARAALA
jgi:hypothetical protein